MPKEYNINKVDIIVIGYNESPTLEKCILSAQAAARRLKLAAGIDGEVVYVDSYSTDDSLQIAGKSGVRILRAPQRFHTCSHARNTGLCLTKGEYVMFLDGDMEMDESWLVHGMNYLLSHESAGGVAGIRDDYRLYKGCYTVISNYFNTTVSVETVRDDVGGAFLFRRKALEQTGGFEPEIAPEEDYVLYCQLKTRGWELYRINHAMIRHWDNKISSRSGIMKHLIFNRKASVPGVIFRYALYHTGWWKMYLFRFQKYLMLHALWLAVLAGAFALYIFGNLQGPYALIAALLSNLIYLKNILADKKDCYRVFAALPLRTIYLFNFCRGFIFNAPKITFGIQFSKAYIDDIKRINKC